MGAYSYIPLMPNLAVCAWAYDMHTQVPDIRIESFAFIAVLCLPEYLIARNQKGPNA